MYPRLQPHVPEAAAPCMQVRFYEDTCAAVHAIDASVPCVVGPAPFYKVWQRNSLALPLTRPQPSH